MTHKTCVKIHLFELFLLTRMEELRERKMMMAKSVKDAPGPSLFSSHHLNRVCSSPLLCTQASHPTRATCAPRFASPTTPSPCPPTRLHRSSALFGKALASTSPLSCPLLQPAARACHLLLPPSQQRAACCDPVSKKNKINYNKIKFKIYIGHLHKHAAPGLFIINILHKQCNVRL